MELPRLFRWIVAELEAARIPYGIGGSIATMHYGKFRATNDMDVVVAPTQEQLDRLVAAANAAGFYASDIAAADALRRSGSMNVIDPDTAYKADLFVVTLDEHGRGQLTRTKRSVLFDSIQADFCSVEDTVLKKLEYFAAGGSTKHVDDIAQILLIGVTPIDREFIESEARRLGLLDQWRQIVAAAEGSA